MKGLSEEKYARRMKALEEKAADHERYRKYKEERNKLKSKIKYPSTSKLIVAFVVVLVVEILAFTEYAMLKTWDVSCLYALISIPTTLVPTLLGYFNKSKSENTLGGITYDMAMAQLNASSEDDSVG